MKIEIEDLNWKLKMKIQIKNKIKIDIENEICFSHKGSFVRDGK